MSEKAVVRRSTTVKVMYASQRRSIRPLWQLCAVVVGVVVVAFQPLIKV